MLDGLGRCKIIVPGSVGVDSVDVAAAPARGIPVTNVPRMAPDRGTRSRDEARSVS